MNIEACLPALRWDACLDVEQDNPVFKFEDNIVELEGVRSEPVLQVATMLDGRTPINVIAEQTSIDRQLVIAIIKALMSAGVVVDCGVEQESDIAPEFFAAACRRLYAVWKNRLFSHPLWETLRIGKATQSQFAGWLIESYHFIEGVNDRLALNIAECADSKVKPLFIRHYIEEYDHSHFFITALGALGYDARLVESTRPLPATLAVLNHMRHCARRGPLEYAVCSGFLESTGGDRTSGLSFLDRVEKHYAADRPMVIKPLVSHIRLDEAYGHNDMLERVCAQVGKIARDRASEALGLGALFIETMELWSTDILKTYADPVSFPRTSIHRYRPLAVEAE
jgi:pyrroloquinoline quinone (PQQ) biosynthesis protein C